MAEAHRQREKNVEERLKALLPQYAIELAKATTFILVLGDDAEKFASIAKTDADCYIFDLEKYYDRITNVIAPINFVGKRYSPYLVEMINNSLMDIGLELEMVNSIPAVVFKSKDEQQIGGVDQFKKLTKQVVNESVGGDFAGLYAVRQVCDQAIEANFSGNFFPLVVYSKDTSLLGIAKDLEKIGKYSFTVFAGKDSAQNGEGFFDAVSSPEKMSVIASLKKIRATIKKHKENN